MEDGYELTLYTSEPGVVDCSSFRRYKSQGLKGTISAFETILGCMQASRFLEFRQVSLSHQNELQLYQTYGLQKTALDQGQVQ
jgi:hypothetical protein